ncbi:MAG: hypothetical protein ACLP22_20260 [Solirubrobacteraceae bacterium]
MLVNRLGRRLDPSANLRGTGYVARDFTWQEITGELTDGTEVTIRVRFAGLQGYLLSKCITVRNRAATKDYYDLAYGSPNLRSQAHAHELVANVTRLAVTRRRSSDGCQLNARFA